MLPHSQQRSLREHDAASCEPQNSPQYGTPSTITNALELGGAVILGLANLSYDPTHTQYLREKKLNR